MKDHNGGLAQLARAPALHAGGQGFESLILHQIDIKLELISFEFYCVQIDILLIRIKLNFVNLEIHLYIDSINEHMKTINCF